MKLINSFLLLLSIVSVFSACHKDEYSAIELEEVSGYSFYYDENGNKSDDNNGILISIVGDTISTTTKADGSWRFSHLKPGTYSFSFSKPGFCTMKVIGKMLTGGYKFLDTVAIYPILHYSIALTKFSVNPGNTLLIDGYFNGSVPDCPCCHLFFGKTSNVTSDPENYLQEQAIFAPGSEAGEFNGFEFVFINQLLKEKGFLPGDTVYVVAFSDYAVAKTYNTWEIAWYNESETVKVFPNIGLAKSNILSLVLP
jgi:hypothetical protein